MMIEAGCVSCDSCEADLPQSLFALARTNPGEFIVFGLPYMILGEQNKELVGLVTDNNKKSVYRASLYNHYYLSAERVDDCEL